MATAAAPRMHDLQTAVATALGEALLLDPEVTAALAADTPLFGHLPELDSMAVATVLTALEDRFAIIIDDADVSADMFATLCALTSFVGERLAASPRPGT
jgi:acyl carrier protein